MAIKAGRVGVRADQVDPYGRLKKDKPVENLTLSLDENAGGDPVINLEYDSDGEHYVSPAAFDKDDFELNNNHLKVKKTSGSWTRVNETPVTTENVVIPAGVNEVCVVHSYGQFGGVDAYSLVLIDWNMRKALGAESVDISCQMNTNADANIAIVIFYSGNATSIKVHGSSPLKPTVTYYVR